MLGNIHPEGWPRTFGQEITRQTKAQLFGVPAGKIPSSVPQNPSEIMLCHLVPKHQHSPAESPVEIDGQVCIEKEDLVSVVSVANVDTFVFESNGWRSRATFVFYERTVPRLLRSGPATSFVHLKVHVLSEDICSLSRNSKENLDVLGDLESRVKKLRYTNIHGSSTRPWADRQVQAHPCRFFVVRTSSKRSDSGRLAPECRSFLSVVYASDRGPEWNRSCLWIKQSHTGSVGGGAFKLLPWNEQLSLCSSSKKCASFSGRHSSRGLRPGGCPPPTKTYVFTWIFRVWAALAYSSSTGPQATLSGLYVYPTPSYGIHGNPLAVPLFSGGAVERVDWSKRREYFLHLSKGTRFCPGTQHVQVDVDLKADLARPNALMFKVCSKCNARVLKKVLDLHERFCVGAVERWGFRGRRSCFCPVSSSNSHGGCSMSSTGRHRDLKQLRRGQFYAGGYAPFPKSKGPHQYIVLLFFGCFSSSSPLHCTSLHILPPSAPISLHSLYPFASSLEDEPDDDEDDADAAGGEGEVGGEVGNAREENMKPCELCRRPFRKERLAKHEEACKKKAKAIGQFGCRFSSGLACRSSTTARAVGLCLTKWSTVGNGTAQIWTNCNSSHVMLVVWFLYFVQR